MDRASFNLSRISNDFFVQSKKYFNKGQIDQIKIAKSQSKMNLPARNYKLSVNPSEARGSSTELAVKRIRKGIDTTEPIGDFKIDKHR